MKIIHIPYCYWPDAVGGTEIYVESLAREQQRLGFDVAIAAPGNAGRLYTHNGLPVWRFPVSEQIADLRDLYGEGDPVAAEAFGRVLDQEGPDVVHLHALTRGASLRVVREAKRRGIPVAFSYHTPTVSCQRGTLLRWGSEICDGALHVKTCAQCALDGHGLNRIGSMLAGSLPSGVGRLLGSLGASGGPWTAARFTELVALRHQVFRDLAAEVDHIAALCEWVKDLLLRNGVAGEKITVSRQGLDRAADAPFPQPPTRPVTLPLRIAFLGRLDPTKGVHILIEALRRKPALAVQLDVMGIAQGESGQKYLQALRAMADGDGRVDFREPIPSEHVVDRLRDYDLLAVPSQWLETGPRVVLEAFAAGIPVIGSNLGGIAELIEHGVNGLLSEPRSIDAWADGMESICRTPDLLSALRQGIRPPRGVRDVACEMQQIYSKVLQQVAVAI
jgi:glycosyltransferase involved in cell wall biosynthesis